MSAQQHKSENQANRPGLTWYQKQIIKAHSELITLGQYLSASDWRKLRQGHYFAVLDGLTTELDKLEYKTKIIKSFINLKKQQQHGNFNT